MKIEVGKYYKTRDRRKARIYAVDCGGNWPIHGAIHYDGFWVACEWMSDGERFINTKSQSSLIPEWTEPLDFDPSCLPAWAEWIAMDLDGEWSWYMKRPRLIDVEYWIADAFFTRGVIRHEYNPKNFTGDWKDSLYKVSDLKTNQS